MERFEISLPVRLEWDDAESGQRVSEDGRTENVSQHGTLVHLSRTLPRVGSDIELSVYEAKGEEVVRVPARVLRVERNPARPLAALRLTDSNEAWRKNVWSNQELIDAFTESADSYEE